MPNIRVEYTNEGEEVILDRDVITSDGVDTAFDDIGRLIGLPFKSMRQEMDSIYEGVDDDDQFNFQFDEEGGGQTSSPFEAVVADQVKWNEKYPNPLYSTFPFDYELVDKSDLPSESKLSEDVDISDRPAQQTLRVDSDEDNNFYYYNGA